MAPANSKVFFNTWQKYTILSMAIIEVIIIIVFVFTELGNVASNFWLTNVFAGTWCGLVLLIHCMSLFANAFCLPGAKPAFVTLIITIVALLACALLIVFDALFIAQPSTCVLTPQCTSNSQSTSSFSYSMSQNFFGLFNNLNGFKTYTLLQAKYLFQTVQISVGALGFVLCLVYIIIYFMRKQETGNRVSAFNDEQVHRPTPAPKKEHIRTDTGRSAVRKPQRSSYVS